MESKLDRAIAEAEGRRALPSPHEFRRARQAAGVSQEVIADELGVSRATISRWESGNRSPAATRHAEYLAVYERLFSAATHAGRDRTAGKHDPHDDDSAPTEPSVRSRAGGAGAHEPT